MSKYYKFSLDRKIRDFVEWELRYYWDNKRQLEETKEDMIPSPTRSISPTNVSFLHSQNSQVEDTVIKIISTPYIQRLEWSIKAIERALARLNDEDIKLIKLYYWRNEYTLEGAGYKIGYSRAATYRKANKILGAIAFEMGYINE